MTECVFAEQTVDGVVSTALSLAHFPKVYSRFVTAGTFPGEIKDLARVSYKKGIYLFNPVIIPSNYKAVKDALCFFQDNPVACFGSRTFHHMGEFKFDSGGVDLAKSAAEQLWSSLEIDVPPIFPAIASAASSFIDTPAMQQVDTEQLAENASILQYAFAYTDGTYGPAKDAARFLAEGKLPEESDFMQDMAERAREVKRRTLSSLDIKNTDGISWCEVNKLGRRGYNYLVAEAIARESESGIGVLLQHKNECLSAHCVSVRAIKPRLCDLVHTAAHYCDGDGTGNRFRARATLNPYKKGFFMPSLADALTKN